MATVTLPIAQGLKCVTRKHATTCIRNEVFKMIEPLSGGNFFLKEEEPECWGEDELQSDYTLVVNLMNESFSLLNEKRKTLKDKTEVCAYESELVMALEIYALGCKITKDMTTAVFSQIAVLLFEDTGGYPLIPFVRSAMHGSFQFTNNFEYDTERTRLSVPITVGFDYVPSRPSLLFTRKQNV